MWRSQGFRDIEGRFTGFEGMILRNSDTRKGDITPTVDTHLEKKTEHQMESRST